MHTAYANINLLTWGEGTMLKQMSCLTPTFHELGHICPWYRIYQENANKLDKPGILCWHLYFSLYGKQHSPFAVSRCSERHSAKHVSGKRGLQNNGLVLGPYPHSQITLPGPSCCSWFKCFDPLVLLFVYFISLVFVFSFFDWFTCSVFHPQPYSLHSQT